MPNYCDTWYKIICNDESKLLKFYIDMARASGCFGGIETETADWVGNMYTVAGYSEEEIDARGFHVRGWDLEITKEGNVVTIHCTMAWEPGYEAMQTMLREKYGSEDKKSPMEVYLLAEEPGAEIYINTDKSGEYFQDSFVVDYSIYEEIGEGESKESIELECDRIYYSDDNEEDFVNLINRLVDGKYKSAKEIMEEEDEIREIFERKFADGSYLGIHKFTEY